MSASCLVTRATLAERWDLHEVGCFLPLDTPVCLPEDVFAGWETIVKNLPQVRTKTRGDLLELIRAQEVAADDVETFLHSCEPRFLRRAHVVFGFIAQALIHGFNKNPWNFAVDEVPVTLAEPYMVVNQRLGLPGITCACTFDTYNWTLRNPKDGIQLSNMKSVSRMTSESAEVAFHLTSTMHGIMADALFDLLLCPEAIRNKDLIYLRQTMRKIRRGLLQCIKIFKYMVKNLDGDSFDRYRPLLQGCYPVGARFARRNDVDPTIVCAKGASAGQSAMFFLLDSALQVQHKGSAAAFAEEMLSYLPRQHRECVLDFKSRLAKSGSLREVKGLEPEYRSALHALLAFRTFHMKAAMHFLGKVVTGTGASDFRVMLQETIEETRC